MPAAVAKGIIISISIITALSVAVLENPQVQAWLEQQRQRIVELLRSIGEDLDPQTRRTAEAFAYEGRTPASDPGLQREASGSIEAAAVATGRSLSNASTIRRIPISGPSDPDEAAERRRKGREYLAKRNQQMHELQLRKKGEKAEGASTPPTPTSFDAMVDDEGKLRLSDTEKELPSPPAIEPLPEPVKAEMREVERQLTQPLLEGEPSSSSFGAAGWSFGSLLANPFSDEYAVDRSETPKPPVPPKVALEVVDDPPISTIPGSFTPRAVTPQPQQRNEDLSYEEQLAIALSLSEEEAARSAVSSVQDHEDDDADLRAAIAASLKEMETHKAASASIEPRPVSQIPEPQPLVDLTPPSPTIRPQHPVPRSRWETLFDQAYSPTHEPLSLASNASQHEDEDELYRVTPELTYARLATLNSQQSLSSPLSSTSMPYDPVREAASQTIDAQQGVAEASFYTTAASPASTHTMDHEPSPQLVDVSEDAPAEGARTPTSRASFGFQSDPESDSDTFASLSGSASRAQSRPRSEISNVEVIDVVDDSDVDMLSEEGDGIATPDSWSEIGSREGDSEMEDLHQQHPRHIPIQ